MLHPTRLLAGSPGTHHNIADSGGLGALVRVLRAEMPAAMQAGAEACRCVRFRCGMPRKVRRLALNCQAPEQPHQISAHLVSVRSAPYSTFAIRPPALISLAACQTVMHGHYSLWCSSLQHPSRRMCLPSA